ncbi:hypothetical protein V8C34DRAFT_289750 [Trichoderma compactum]
MWSDLPRTLPGVQPSPGFRAVEPPLDFEGAARAFNGRPCAYVCCPWRNVTSAASWNTAQATLSNAVYSKADSRSL